MQVEHTNVFYFKSINAIGGVESFFYYLSKLYKNMVVYYNVADEEQVKRLAENIEVHKWNGETIKCKRFFGNYGLDILDYVDAKEKYFIIHCDYKRNKVCKPIVYPGFKYIAVSELARRSFYEMTGIDAEVIYNPVAIDKPKNAKKKKGLHLIVCSRLSSEKGGWRYDKLAELLDNKGIKYDMTIYSNKTKKVDFGRPNVILKEPKLYLGKEMAESTYLVQLSDYEAFGLSPAEALSLGTPVIVTDIEAFHEIGCKDGENAIFVDLNMLNVDIDRIVKGLPKFTYTPPKSNWDKYLDNNSTYNPNDLVEVTVLKRKYFDIELKKWFKYGDNPLMTKKRKAYLEAKGFVE